MMSNLREYIFIDERRVKSYYHQLKQGKILKVEKKGKWTASATTSKLGIERSSVKSFREPTLPEMISVIDKKILKKNLFRNDHNQAEFRKYTLEAQRALILPNESISKPPNDHHHLAVWLPTKYLDCTEDSWMSEVAVYLIESSPEKEGVHKNFSIYSSYSLLEFMVNNLNQETIDFRASLIGSDSENLEEIKIDNFFLNPAKYLESFGAKLSEPKKITTLVRVRNEFCDEGFNENRPERYGIWGIIGYPIYIYLA